MLLVEGAELIKTSFRITPPERSEQLSLTTYGSGNQPVRGCQSFEFAQTLSIICSSTKNDSQDATANSSQTQPIWPTNHQSPGDQKFPSGLWVSSECQKKTKTFARLDYIEPGDTADNNEERIETDRNTRE
ncbi:hypothetical protein BCON_0735g00030 [Botryotinia convoluta]|uniref:Uncharacterized protein n=1 Tax=Botryotinia convoluta TaxID=54673 RepID=A0A4Z1H3Z1_9HELO|nr:hypothetical protein BCON_0735g00030 [Botryotinia convoluta]